MSFINCKVIKSDCSYQEYHSQDAKRGDKEFSMSRSELVEFAHCPAKYILGPHEDDATPSTDFGSLVDCLVTQPEKFDSLFVVCPEFYTNKKGEKSEWRNDKRIAEVAEFLDANEGKTIIKTAVKADVDAAVKNIQVEQGIMDLIRSSAKQVFVCGFWKDEATGIEIPLRALIDLVPPASHERFGKWLCDLKTARNGDPAQWARVVDDCSYDVQGALYMDLYLAATKEDRTDWVFVVQENAKPFHVVKPLPALTSEFLQWGRLKYMSALRLYADCLARNQWPGYAATGLTLGDMQLIAPDELWNYKKTAGLGKIER
jgi:exodeoxyribonuclease VIII